KHEAHGSGATAAAPADDLTWREVQQALHAELNRLSDCYRTPLVLCYLEGKTQDEAAWLLRVSRATVKKRLESARALLRQRLVRRNGVLDGDRGAFPDAKSNPGGLRNVGHLHPVLSERRRALLVRRRAAPGRWRGLRFNLHDRFAGAHLDFRLP